VTTAPSGNAQTVGSVVPAFKIGLKSPVLLKCIEYVLEKPLSKSVRLQSTISNVGGTDSATKDRRRHRPLRNAEAVPLHKN
jgi:hypothetical protein